MGEAITKYGWSDGKKKVDIFIEDEGLKGITKDDVNTTSGAKEATIEIANFGGKKRVLTLKGLTNEIDGVDVALKLDKEPPRVVLKLKKKEEQPWYQLLESSGGGGGSDDEGGMGGMPDMGGMPGMGGMGGMPGMEGMDMNAMMA